MTPNERVAFTAGIQAAMTPVVSIEVLEDAREVRQQAAAATLHGLAAVTLVGVIAGGLGIVTNGVLCVTGPELKVDEWAARHVTEH